MPPVCGLEHVPPQCALADPQSQDSTVAPPPAEERKEAAPAPPPASKPEPARTAGPVPAGSPAPAPPTVAAPAAPVQASAAPQVSAPPPAPAAAAPQVIPQQAALSAPPTSQAQDCLAASQRPASQPHLPPLSSVPVTAGGAERVGSQGGASSGRPPAHEPAVGEKHGRGQSGKESKGEWGVMGMQHCQLVDFRVPLSRRPATAEAGSFHCRPLTVLTPPLPLQKRLYAIA